MRLSSILEMSASEIEGSTEFLKKKFYSIGIVLNFTKHFGDRILDGAKDEHGKRDNVTLKDLFDTFAKIYSHHKRIFDEAKDFNDEVKRGEFEGVIQDEFTKINVPFVLVFDKNKGKFIITCKTIMKRDNFHTKPTDHVIKV